MATRRGSRVVVLHQMTTHPATLYGFVTALVALIGVIVLVALGDIASDVGVPIISALGLGGVGVAGGVAQAAPRTVTGTVTTVTPDG